MPWVEDAEGLSGVHYSLLQQAISYHGDLERRAGPSRKFYCVSAMRVLLE